MLNNVISMDLVYFTILLFHYNVIGTNFQEEIYSECNSINKF